MDWINNYPKEVSAKFIGKLDIQKISDIENIFEGKYKTKLDEIMSSLVYYETRFEYYTILHPYISKNIKKHKLKISDSLRRTIVNLQDLSILLKVQPDYAAYLMNANTDRELRDVCGAIILLEDKEEYDYFTQALPNKERGLIEYALNHNTTMFSYIFSYAGSHALMLPEDNVELYTEQLTKIADITKDISFDCYCFYLQSLIGDFRYKDVTKQQKILKEVSKRIHSEEIYELSHVLNNYNSDGQRPSFTSWMDTLYPIYETYLGQEEAGVDPLHFPVPNVSDRWGDILNNATMKIDTPRTESNVKHALTIILEKKISISTQCLVFMFRYAPVDMLNTERFKDYILSKREYSNDPAVVVVWLHRTDFDLSDNDFELLRTLSRECPMSMEYIYYFHKSFRENRLPTSELFQNRSFSMILSRFKIRANSSVEHCDKRLKNHLTMKHYF